jgi:dTDP-4-dehydrorhamnose reductase
MLGSALESYFKFHGIQVSATTRRAGQQGMYLDVGKNVTTVENLEQVFRDFDIVINCLVVRTLEANASFGDGIFINSLFPHLAAEACNRLDRTFIQISTDGVFSGFGGPYYEDNQPDGVGPYSCSKILGEVIERQALNIRCSIIGHEDAYKGGLLAWFLAQEKPVNGFRNVIWNGVTTVQLASFIHQLIVSGQYLSIMERTRILHFSPNAPMSKYDLLRKIAEVYGKKVDILEVDGKVGISRILKTRFDSYFVSSDDFTNALHELREFHLS